MSANASQAESRSPSASADDKPDSPERLRKRRVCFVAWYLRPDRRWLGEHVDPERYECGYVASGMHVDIRNKRTSPRVWLGFLLLALKARWHLLWNKYDLVVSAFPQLGSLLALVNGLTFERTPHVVWYFNCGHRYRGLRLWLSRIAFRGVSRFIVYSRAERRSYAEWFQLPEGRFHFTHLTGVALDRADYRGTREKYKLGPRYIVSAGSSGRDFKTLVDAVAGLGVETVLVTHPYAVAGVTLPPTVRLLESIPQEDYLGILTGADLVVLPVNNIDTASGQMTLIQAMTLGVPVVATRCIGTEDYIREGETGFFVPMGDVPAMREAISRVVSEPGLRDRLAGNALRFARGNFVDSAGARVLESVFEEVQGTR